MADPNYFPPPPAPPSKIEQAVVAGVEKAVVRTAADPTVPGVRQDAAPAIIEAVLNQILPAILHSTSQEPWYRSRVFWSAIISVIGLVAGIFGYSIDDAQQQQWLLLIMAGNQAVAAILAIWGRYAKKPIGS
jgi:hypothetical protein